MPIVIGMLFAVILLLIFLSGLRLVRYGLQALKRRQSEQLLEQCKMQWWGAELPSDYPRFGVQIASKFSESGQLKSARNWKGFERRGSCLQFKRFRNYGEIEHALNAVLASEMAVAENKLANSSIWHGIGRVQALAIHDVRSVIDSISRDKPHDLWLSELYAQLKQLSDRDAEEMPPDVLECGCVPKELRRYYRSTVNECMRAIMV